MSNAWRSLCVTVMVERNISNFELYKYLRTIKNITQRYLLK